MISAVITYDDNRVSIHTSKAKNVSEKFSPGFYRASFDRQGNLNISCESLNEIHLPFSSDVSQSVVKSVQSFFTLDIKNKVNTLGFIHKLGILLYGKAGTGKTTILNFIANKMMENREAIVFFCNKGETLEGALALAKMIREIQDNPIIFIADEFERYATQYESEMKNFLDGNESIDNTLFLAATNYIEDIPETLKERPSRFRIVEEFEGIEDKKVMKKILKDISEKLQPSLLSDKEINRIVKGLNSCTIDELKHICLDKLTDSYVKLKKRESIGFSKKSEEMDFGLDSDFDFESTWALARELKNAKKSGFSSEPKKDTKSNI